MSVREHALPKPGGINLVRSRWSVSIFSSPATGLHSMSTILSTLMHSLNLELNTQKGVPTSC